MAHNDYEVLVVGGGPAGLSATLYLARYDRTVALFDTGQGRSTWHQTAYNYLGFPGGIKARELRDTGYRQIAEYSQVTVFRSSIERLSKQGEWYIAHGEAGEAWRGQALILCTGVTDHWPEFPGWEEYVGRSMFWCLTCDGYSSRGMSIVVVGNSDEAGATACQLTRFTDRVTLLTNSDEMLLSEDAVNNLATCQVHLIHDRIESVDGKNGYFRALYTRGGQCIELDRLFNQQGATPNVKLALDLGVALDENGYIKVDSEQKTNVPQVYAAGDVDGKHSHQISTAVHEGGQAASAANYFLYPSVLKEE